MYFNQVRTTLLEEARKSPKLLADLAGLEWYVAESYHTRSFTELLQNADDAGAARFKVQQVGEYVLVANDGRVFTPNDFESLCRSAHSSKVRGTSIGFRGIGFKSVVGFARRIHLFSGDLGVTFSRDRTAQEIPQAERVPLIRIPHQVEPAELSPFKDELKIILSEGYSTVFVFGDLIAREIEAEFELFDFTSLLFLRRVRQVEFQGFVETLATVRRQAGGEKVQNIRLTTSRGISTWTVIRDGDIAVAFGRDDSGICRLDEKDAVVHAFLPTEEVTGLGVKVNGDVSTDPSRRQVILDEHTAVAVKQIASLIIELIGECLADSSHVEEPIALLGALVPSADPRMMALRRRSFSKELLYALKDAAGQSFENLRCRPEWLNAEDFQKLATQSDLWSVDRKLGATKGLTSFLRFLGAREATFEELSLSLVSVSPSTVGCAEIAAYLTGRYSTKQLELSAISENWRIWPIDDSFYSLEEAEKSAMPLRQEFIDMVGERITSPSDFRRFLGHLVAPSIASLLLPGTEAGKAEPLDEGTVASPETQLTSGSTEDKYPSLKKWRSGEQQVLSLLSDRGYILSDVSRQNLGYDLEGMAPEGTPVFIEVKTIDYPGQPFTLTNNEVAVAGEKTEMYFLAIVRQSSEALEVAMIQDPANRLAMTRKCRQWMWECSSYNFEPEAYSLE